MAKRILVVDDAMFMRKTLRSILEQAGYEVIGEAGNGIELLKMYPTLQPDLVTLDITMPEMDGLDAAKALCAMYPQAKVVMVSAMGQKEMVIDAIKSGAKDFIVKPFEPARVQETVRKIVG